MHGKGRGAGLFGGAGDFDRKSSFNVTRTSPALPRRRAAGLVRGGIKFAALGRVCVTLRRRIRSFAPDIVYLPSMYPLAAMVPTRRARLVTTFHGGEIVTHVQRSRLGALGTAVDFGRLVLPDRRHRPGQLVGVL